MQIDASVSLSCDVGNLNSNVPSCFLCSFPPLYYFLVPFLSFEREKNHEMSRLPERWIQILPKSFFIQNQILFRSYLRRTEKKLILSFFLYFFLFLRVYFGEHELLPGGGCGFDSPSSQSHPSDRTTVQHHMKDQTIKKPKQTHIRTYPQCLKSTKK